MDLSFTLFVFSYFLLFVLFWFSDKSVVILTACLAFCILFCNIFCFVLRCLTFYNVLIFSVGLIIDCYTFPSSQSVSFSVSYSVSPQVLSLWLSLSVFCSSFYPLHWSHSDHPRIHFVWTGLLHCLRVHSFGNSFCLWPCCRHLFFIVNFPFSCSNITTAPAYMVPIMISLIERCCIQWIYRTNG